MVCFTFREWIKSNVLSGKAQSVYDSFSQGQ